MRLTQSFVITAAALSVVSAAAGILFLQRLKRAPPLSEADRRAGLGGMWTRVDGTPIFARVSRRPAPAGGLPVVPVHGLVISSRSMVPMAGELVAEFPVYAPDLPGFGESGRPARALNVVALADALYRWMQALGMPRAIFIGSSFGCQIIAALAERHRVAVERAVLLGPTVDPAARSFLRQAWRLMLNSRREPPSELGRLSRIDYAKAGIGRVIRTVRFTLRDRIEDRLPQMTQPILVVRGSLDPVVPQDWAERATALLPDGRLAIMNGGSHALNLTHPRGLVAAIRPFLVTGAYDSTPVDD